MPREQYYDEPIWGGLEQSQHEGKKNIFQTALVNFSEARERRTLARLARQSPRARSTLTEYKGLWRLIPTILQSHPRRNTSQPK